MCSTGTLCVRCVTRAFSVLLQCSMDGNARSVRPKLSQLTVQGCYPPCRSLNKEEPPRVQKQVATPCQARDSLLHRNTTRNTFGRSTAGNQRNDSTIETFCRPSRMQERAADKSRSQSLSSSSKNIVAPTKTRIPERTVTGYISKLNCPSHAHAHMNTQ